MNLYKLNWTNGKIQVIVGDHFYDAWKSNNFTELDLTFLDSFEKVV